MERPNSLYERLDAHTDIGIKHYMFMFIFMFIHIKLLTPEATIKYWGHFH